MPNPLRRFAGDPTHPATVHFPLALYPAAVLFDILALTTNDGTAYTRAAFVAMLAATVMAVIAATTGFVQLLDVPAEPAIWRLALIHMSVQLVAVSILSVSLVLRLGHVGDAQPPTLAFVLAIAGTVVLLVGGWLGGHMVFTHGVSVEPGAARSDAAPVMEESPMAEPVVPAPNGHRSDSAVRVDR